MNKGSVFIISGPSGSGKDTLISALLKEHPEIVFSISAITRPMRQGEKQGEKYNFISRDAFEDMIKADQLLEYNCYVGNYYGTPAAPVIEATSEGKDILIEVDVNGAANIRKKLPDAISIFIMPPSYKELLKRLEGRGTEPQEVINKRMEAAVSEIKRAEEYDYIVTNKDVETAVSEIFAIIQAHRLKIENQKNFINEVLGKC